MPMHDWTKVNSGLFHHFHQGWCWEICRALNRGSLPDGYTALVEQRSGSKEADLLAIEERVPNERPAEFAFESSLAVQEKPLAKYVMRSEKDFYGQKASRVVIRHHLGRVVSFIEVVSPGNKHDNHSFDEFCTKIIDAIRDGIHVLVVDLFPPTRRDPCGIHKAIWDYFDEDEPFDLAAPQNRVLVSYEADVVNVAYIETLGLKERLPAMPLFIRPGSHVLVPLEEAYMQAWSDTPKSVRQLIE